jgi:hypothetical protein
MADITTAGTAEDRRLEIQKEYGAYVAAEDIFINGVLAFATGYPVPISHTKLYPSLLEKNADGNAPVKRVEADAPAAAPKVAPKA